MCGVVFADRGRRVLSVNQGPVCCKQLSEFRCCGRFVPSTRISARLFFPFENRSVTFGEASSLVDEAPKKFFDRQFNLGATSSASCRGIAGWFGMDTKTNDGVLDLGSVDVS